MQETISGRSTVVATSQQVSTDLAGDVIIFSLQSGVYYGLDAVGARIWEIVQQPTAIDAIREAIQEEYDVEAERCERDVRALVAKLAAEGLVEIHVA